MVLNKAKYQSVDFSNLGLSGSFEAKIRHQKYVYACVDWIQILFNFFLDDPNINLFSLRWKMIANNHWLSQYLS